jgi:hypothetical protein
MTHHGLSPVVADVTVAGVIALVVILGAASALGVWLGKRLGRLTKRPGEPEVALREKLRRNRAELRRELTLGERWFVYGYMALCTFLGPVAIVLLLLGPGAPRTVGFGLLLAALVVMAVPISPFIRARVRRRERRSSGG